MSATSVTEVSNLTKVAGMEALSKILTELLGRMSAADLGSRIGVAAQTVRNWAKGDNVPAADHLPALSEVTGKDVYELLGMPRPGGPAGLTESERLLVATIRILQVDPEEVLKAIYRVPRPPIALDPNLRQLSAYNLTPSPDRDLEPPPPDRDDDEARPGRRPRSK